MIRLSFALLIALVTACGSSEPPNCEQAIRTAVKQVAGDDKPSEAEIAELVSTCISEKWTAVVRTCVSNAKKPEQVVSCISGREVADGDLSPKRSEAELNLEAIKKSARTTFVEKGEYPRGSVGLTPAQPCCGSGGRSKCQGNSSNWMGVPAWDMLDFDVPEDHYFQYSYESDGQTYEAQAVGDLDCDGKTVTYTIRGRIENGTPVAELLKPSNPD